MVDIYCKNCGHYGEKHEDNHCNEKTMILETSCSCDCLVEVQISNVKELSNEFREAYDADRQFVESTKNEDGVHVIKDFSKAVLLHERQSYLWSKLLNS